ncbi:hypothetical protein [Nocardia niigatensis]|uniref:hypothetical protein n=1 Tax=Nocardia niigatensis TaxID=209249 RepID=UPI0002F2061D|nr:hypothetical protein [Nocardia niigatensis]
MFNDDGLMKPEGAHNVLRILAQYSRNVAPVLDRIDLGATYTNEFAEKAQGARKP